VAIALKVRSSWPTEIDGTVPAAPDELDVEPEVVDELVELLQAAAARHRASVADTASPFLAT
jgi:hypothetical protein